MAKRRNKTGRKLWKTPGAVVNTQKSLLEEISHKPSVDNLKGLPLLWAAYRSPLDLYGSIWIYRDL